MALAPALSRRSFLRLLVATAAASVAPSAAPRWIAGRGLAHHPGARIDLQLAAAAPAECSVRLSVRHAGQHHPGQAIAAGPGLLRTLETPYPYSDLVPGHYQVVAELLDHSGAVIDHIGVGDYRVRAYRFSA
jgi:hypothetical protein